MTADLQLYRRDGSRFVVADDVLAGRRPHPPIPTPVRVAVEPASVDALGRPAPACGQHIASWAAYTTPAGQPGCKLCDRSKGTRR